MRHYRTPEIIYRKCQDLYCCNLHVIANPSSHNYNMESKWILEKYTSGIIKIPLKLQKAACIRICTDNFRVHEEPECFESRLARRAEWSRDHGEVACIDFMASGFSRFLDRFTGQPPAIRHVDARRKQTNWSGTVSEGNLMDSPREIDREWESGLKPSLVPRANSPVLIAISLHQQVYPRFNHRPSELARFSPHSLTFVLPLPPFHCALGEF